MALMISSVERLVLALWTLELLLLLFQIMNSMLLSKLGRDSMLESRVLLKYVMLV
jgi:hypothetical protein